MKLIKHIVLLFLFALGVSSCGFTPVYAPDSNASAKLSEISVAPPKNNRQNFFLVAELENLIGRNSKGNKVLEHNLSLSSEGVSEFGSARRARLIGSVTYSVMANRDRRPLYSGSVTNFVTYSTERSTTANAFDDAVERLVSILADQIITDLMAQAFSSRL